MSSESKMVFKGFDYQNCDDFAAYLHKMSASGWHFKEWGAGLVFEKGECRDIVYAVEVFMDGTEYDTRPEPHTREFAEYCEAAGWKLLDAKRKFCIFQKIDPHAVPILTPEERLHNTTKALRGKIWSNVCLGACFTFMQWTRYLGSQFPHQIFDNSTLMITLVWTVLFLSALLRCIQFYWWWYQLRKQIDRGESIYLGKDKGIRVFTGGWYGAITSVLMGLWMISFVFIGQYEMLAWFVSILLLFLIMGFGISKLRPDPVTNQLIQLAFSIVIILGGIVFAVWSVFSRTEADLPNDVPLYYEDIGLTAGVLEDSRFEQKHSIFGSWIYCTLDYAEEYVYYNIYRSEYEWVLDRIWEDAASARYNQVGTDCTALWEAQEAYLNGRGEYMVRYEDMILTFSGDEDMELTSQQIDTIRRILTER